MALSGIASPLGGVNIERLRFLPPDVMVLVAEGLYRTNNPILKPTQETDRDHNR